MFCIRKSIDIDFAHHVRGHGGPCIHVHGHTWRFEVELQAEELDDDGFVVDFKQLKQGVLQPCHALLDHSLAIGEATWSETAPALTSLGEGLLQSRMARHGTIATSDTTVTALSGAENRYPGGMKVAVFPFSPTSERLAKWLFDVASQALTSDRVSVRLARVFETQRPVESVAEYWPS
ncbi:MAG: 6-carboxytetrahydropterin synthase [Myxococcales bacterium]|nr:6-carboxytetrahydropterin synthase [Myxococcales bacterium]